jgi:hypothetical protein
MQNTAFDMKMLMGGVNCFSIRFYCQMCVHIHVLTRCHCWWELAKCNVTSILPLNDADDARCKSHFGYKLIGKVVLFFFWNWPAAAYN